MFNFKNKKITIVFLSLIGVVIMLSGCSFFNEIINDGPISGGTTNNTNYLAPKHIDSNDLVYFSTKFYRYSDYVYENDCEYLFKMNKTDDGKYIISEGINETLKCETDVEFVNKLQQIIIDNNLVSLNGTDKITHGLPPEYGKSYLEAKYASNEKLYFCMNNDPMSKWSFEVLDLFAKEFGKHGINDLLPPKEDSYMTRFNLEYAFGDVRHVYGEIYVPVTEEEKARTVEDIITNGINKDGCVLMVYSDPWDRSGKTELEDNRRVEVSQKYYQDLQKIVEDTELVYFQNGYSIPTDFDYENTPQFYEFYIEYQSGKIMSGFSDNPEECEKFKPIAEAFAQYFEDYLDGRK